MSASSTYPAPSQFGPGWDVVCDDPAVALAVRQWLSESRLTWPGRLRFEVAVAAASPFGEDAREVLRQPGVTIQAGPPSGSVRITWERAPAAAEVHATEPRATIWLSPEAVPRLEEGGRTFLLVVLVFMLRRLGWYHVHGAAMIDPRGRGWMLAGDSNCGKSTTVALLCTRGWQVSTDDIGFVVHRGTHAAVIGYRSPIALRQGGLELLGARGGSPLLRRQKSGFWPEDLGGEWAHEVVPHIIAFPRLGDRTSLAPIAGRDVLANLVKWSHWVLHEPLHAQEHLDSLGRLAGQARSFRLTLGPDLFNHPELLEELVP